MLIALFLAQVPNYSELPPRPDPLAMEICAFETDDLRARVVTYGRWVRDHEIINGGLLTDYLSRVYQAEAHDAVKPFIEYMTRAPRLGAQAADCVLAHDDGWHALGNLAGIRWGASYGYEQTPEGAWVRETPNR